MKSLLPGTPSVQAISTEEMLSILRSHPQLLAKMDYPSFFCSPDWLEGVLKAGRPVKPFAFLVLRGNEPIAVLPLERVRNWLGGIDLRFLGYRYHPDPIGVIVCSSEARQAIQAIVNYMQGQRGWDRLILDCLLEDEAKLWPGTCTQKTVAPYLRLPSDFDELLATFEKKKRYKIRNGMKRAKDAGFEFCVASSPDEKTALLRNFFNMHGKRSEEINRASSIASADVMGLHMHLALHSSDTILFSLRTDQSVAAVVYGFQFANRFFYYQIAHDPDFSAVSPGAVLLSHVIKHYCDAGFSEFNFLQGNEAYKFHWTSGHHRLMQVYCHARHLKARLLVQLTRGW